MTKSRRISKEEISIIKDCVTENKSITLIMCKTGLPRVTILNALRKHLGLKAKEINSLGTSSFCLPNHLI